MSEVKYSKEHEWIKLDGDTAVIADVTIWTGSSSNSFGPFSGCRKFFDSAKGRMAEDAPKMAITDGLTKALSHLGFNADVFLGEMDGNKYAADSKVKSIKLDGDGRLPPEEKW